MKRSVLLLLALLLCVCAFASDDGLEYKVLVHPRDDGLSSFAEEFFVSMPYDGNVVLDREAENRRAELRSLGEALAKAYSSEDPTAIEKARVQYEECIARQETDESDASEGGMASGPFAVVFLDAPGSVSDMDLGKAAEEGDVFSLQLACSVSSADMLLIPVSRILEGFTYTALYVYRKAYDSIDLCFESLSQDGGDVSSSRALLSVARLFFQQPVSIIDFEGIPEGSRIVVDGVDVNLVGGRMLTVSGEHVFEISKSGYATRRFKAVVPEDQVCTMTTGLASLEYGAMEVDSHPKSDVYYDGRLLGTTPVVVEGYTIPLVLRFSADGYVSRTVSLSSPEESLFVELKPQWMSDSDMYVKAKDDFYASFAGSLLLFGLGIAVDSLGSNGGIWYEMAGIALDGALVLSLTNLAANLIEYYRCSEYISP